MDNLQHYDKLLLLEKGRAGVKKIIRKSPYHNRTYVITTIKNRIIGSGRWLVKKLSSMDLQRRNIITDEIKYRKKPQLKKQTAMNKDIANFIINNEKIII